jgi:predicted DNA repair protein MutK
VKLDDLGLHLSRRANAAAQAIGRGLLRAAPLLMKFLSIAGTAAMFLVGGGILVHGVHAVAHAIEEFGASLGGIAGVGGVLKALVPALINAVIGIVAGAVTLAVVTGAKKVLTRS